MMTWTLVVLLVAIPLLKSIISPIHLNRVVIGVLLLGWLLTAQNIILNMSLYTLLSSTIEVNILNNIMEIIIYSASAACLIVSNNKTIQVQELPLVVLFSVVGASIIISATDILTLYLGIELQSFGLYIIAALYFNIPRSVGAGLKYFLLGALASSTILLGIGVLYSFTGTTDINKINILISVGLSNYDYNILFGYGLILVGLLFKLSAAPFHSWAPDVYDDTPTAITTYLIVVPKIAYITVIASLAYFFIPLLYSGNLLALSAAASLIIGAVIGITQIRIKRILTYSTITHVGFMLLIATSESTIESNSSIIFYIMQYTVTNLATFIIIIAIGYHISNRDLDLISNLKGLAYYHPIFAFTLSLLLLSTAGVPPAIGFFAKYSVLSTLILNNSYTLAILAVVASVVSAVYYLSTISTIYFEISKLDITIISNKLAEVESVENSSLCYIIASMTLFVITFSFYPNLILNCTELLALAYI